jgi:biopolymer transport protein ExbD
MADQVEITGFGKDEEEWIQAQRARKARRQKNRREEDGGVLNMNSFMDILVIMLVFLMKNFGDLPIKVAGEDLKVPTSITQLTVEDMTSITISRNAILVNDVKAVDVKDGSVDKSQKKGGEASLYIQPLFDTLSEETKKAERMASLLNKEYEPVVTIVADQTTPYRLLTEVMYTAGQAELSKFKFAVIKGSAEELGLGF